MIFEALAPVPGLEPCKEPRDWSSGGSPIFIVPDPWNLPTCLSLWLFHNFSRLWSHNSKWCLVTYSVVTLRIILSSAKKLGRDDDANYYQDSGHGKNLGPATVLTGVKSRHGNWKTSIIQKVKRTKGKNISVFFSFCWNISNVSLGWKSHHFHS